MNRLILFHFVCSVLLALGTPGCSKPMVSDNGLVRFSDGSPVQSGSIEFRRVTDRKRFASRIGINGEFTPESADGVIGLPAGTYEVVIVQIVMTEDLALESHRHGRSVPRRFADYYTSGLKVTVSDGMTDTIELNLPLDDQEKTQ